MDDNAWEEDVGSGEEELENSKLTLYAEESGERLDRWLVARLAERSRSEVQRWIENGQVTRDGKPLKASYRVAAGDTVTVLVPAVETYSVEPEPIPLNILYEDADILVIDKPAGMVVHPAVGNWHGTLVNAVLYHVPDLAGVGGTGRPGIVHRLDKNTSGLILVAKHDQAHRSLQAQFKSRTVHKTYLALVYGHMSPPQGEIRAPIGRDPRQRKRMAVVSERLGRPAITRYETRACYWAQFSRSGGQPSLEFTLLACHPLTGRTHQIRVHLAYTRHPIVGDDVYGSKRSSGLSVPRQFLHAHSIRFRLPGNDEDVEFTSPLPADLQAVLNKLSDCAAVDS